MNRTIFCGGIRHWKILWAIQSGVIVGPMKRERKSFENFVVEEFGRSMQKLEYIDPGLKEALLIRSDEKNLPLYRLALYSKHKLGAKFWKETKKYSDPQTGFGF